MYGSVQDWFRSLFSGVILADIIRQFRCGSTSFSKSYLSGNAWVATWMTLAQAIANGEDEGIASQQVALKQLENYHPTAAVLGLFPLILTNPEMVAVETKPFTLKADTWNLAESLQKIVWNTAALTLPADTPLFEFPVSSNSSSQPALNTAAGEFLRRA